MFKLRNYENYCIIKVGTFALQLFLYFMTKLFKNNHKWFNLKKTLARLGIDGTSKVGSQANFYLWFFINYWRLKRLIARNAGFSRFNCQSN